MSDVDPSTGYTPEESECSDLLVASNLLVELVQKSLDEFVDAVHRIQGLFPIRIERRIYPKECK